MTTEEMKILDMVSEGKLSAEEASQLLESLASTQAAEKTAVQTQNIEQFVEEEMIVEQPDNDAEPSFWDWVKQLVAPLTAHAGYSEARKSTVDGAGVTALVAQTSNGGIKVVGSDTANIQVEVKKEVKAFTAEQAEAFAQQVEVNIERDGNTLQIYKEHPKPPPGVQVKVAYEIEAPRTLDLTVHTSNGGVRVENVTGAVEAVSSNGQLRLQDISGQIQARTSNGGIKASLSHLQSQSSFSSSNGSIKVDVQEGVAPISAKTSNGAIELKLPTNFSAQVDAKTVNGHIQTDFEATTTKKSRTRFIGQIGDETENTLKLSTVNGHIRFAAQA